MKKLVLLIALIGTIALSLHVPHPEASVIELLNVEGTGGGTGFEVMTPSGHKFTLTNRHMCEHGATNAVLGDRTIPLRVIEVDAAADLCLLEPISGVPALSLASAAPTPGDDLAIYGFGLLLPITRTDGAFVGDSNSMDINMWSGFIPQYTTITILPGNSGSPVLDRHGNVVGVAFASGEVIANRALIVSLADVVTFLSPY